MLKDILSYGIGTLIAFLLLGSLVFLFVRDITQKKHSAMPASGWLASSTTLPASTSVTV